MTMPFNTLFGQRDVRETATATGNTYVGGTGLDASDVSNTITYSLTNKTSYLSIAGCDFQARNPDVDDVSLSADAGSLTMTAGNKTVVAGVNLPQGAVITAAVIYGNAGATDENWLLLREEVNSGANGETMATAAIGTADTSITGGTIANQTYRYWMVAQTLESADTIYGALITYTTDYI